MGIRELLDWARHAPAGTTIPAASLVELLAADQDATSSPAPTAVPPTSWADLLWLAPAERRIGMHELTEAIGRSRSWAYGHLKGARAIPHRKLDGELVFVVGEVRAWIRSTEEVVLEGPVESTAAERRLVVHGGRAS